METSSEPPVVAEMLSEGPNPPSASAAANSLAAARANPFTAASDYPGNRGNGPHDITHAGRAQPIEERRSKQGEKFLTFQNVSHVKVWLSLSRHALQASRHCVVWIAGCLTS